MIRRVEMEVKSITKNGQAALYNHETNLTAM